MVKKILHRLLRHRHFWRDTSFDELSELYVSMIFRSLAIGMVGVFVPFYLYQLGYSLTAIVSVYAWFASAQVAMSYFTAHVVARYGPKHTIFLSYIAQLVSSLLFLTQPIAHWPLIVLGAVWGVAANLFFIAYHVDFSKVKHAQHSGKEVGYMYIMQKVGLAAGPLLGGIVATVFGAQYMFVLAVGLLVLGIVPLFRTKEPVRTRQRLNFGDFPVARAARDFGSYSAFAAEDILTKLVWPLYLSIFVLGAAVYAKLGVLSSVSIVVSIVATYVLARLADQRRGHQMLRIFVGFNALVHLARPFVKTMPQAIGANLLNDTVTAGYALPFFKGMYAAADELPGFRIVYIASMELFANLGRAVVCWLLVIFSLVASARVTLTLGFVIAAGLSCLIALERFGALGPGKGRFDE
jgi:MFS family permease